MTTTALESKSRPGVLHVADHDRQRPRPDTPERRHHALGLARRGDDRAARAAASSR